MVQAPQHAFHLPGLSQEELRAIHEGRVQPPPQRLILETMSTPHSPEKNDAPRHEAENWTAERSETICCETDHTFFITFIFENPLKYVLILGPRRHGACMCPLSFIHRKHSGARSAPLPPRYSRPRRKYIYFLALRLRRDTRPAGQAYARSPRTPGRQAGRLATRPEGHAPATLAPM